MSDAGSTNRIPSQTLSGRINHAGGGVGPIRPSSPRSSHAPINAPAPTTAATAAVPIQSAATMTPTSTSPDTTLTARFIPPGWRAER